MESQDAFLGLWWEYFVTITEALSMEHRGTEARVEWLADGSDMRTQKQETHLSSQKKTLVVQQGAQTTTVRACERLKTPKGRLFSGSLNRQTPRTKQSKIKQKP